MLSEQNFGSQVNSCVILKEIKKEEEERIYCVFSDKSGEMNGYVSVEEKSIMVTSLGKPVHVRGVVTTNDSFTEKLLAVTEISPNENVDYSMLVQGISEEKRMFFKKDINEQLSFLKKVDGRWYEFLLKVLPKNWLEVLSRTGASTIYEAPYLGGALVSCANVSSMVLNILYGYLGRGNGLYPTNGSVGMVVAACYLRYLALPEFLCEEGGKKTLNGLICNYPSFLIRKLERVIGDGSSYGLSQVEVDALINMIECSVSIRSDTRSVTKEGEILRSAVLLYRELDMIDRALSSAPETADEERYSIFYSDLMKRYLLTENRKKETDNNEQNFSGCRSDNAE